MFGFNEPARDSDAIEILKGDHEEVDALFEEYEAKKDAGGTGKGEIARRICDALTVHATIEEEIFYPAVRSAKQDTADLVDEAAVEHQSLKDIIGRLEAAPLKDPLYDAGVKVLSEYVKHHVKEEENELFPKVKSMGIDLVALGERMKARKEELQAKGPARPRRTRANATARASS